MPRTKVLSQVMRRCLLVMAAAGILAAQSGGGKIQVNDLGTGQNSKGAKNRPRIPASGQVHKLRDSCKIRYAIQSETLFEQGQLELAQGAGQILTELGGMLRRETQHPLSVEGHSTSRVQGEKEARYIEAWLVDRGYINARAAEVKGVELTKPGGRVEVVVDTCK